MSESLAFIIGLIAMGCVWYWTDYLGHNSAYRRGYRDALRDEAEIRARRAKREKGGEKHEDT